MAKRKRAKRAAGKRAKRAAGKRAPAKPKAKPKAKRGPVKSKAKRATIPKWLREAQGKVETLTSRVTRARREREYNDWLYDGYEIEVTVDLSYDER